MTKIIGLTGGIGSGKSTVAKMFSSLGVPVYIADDAAKSITDSPEIAAQIRQTFGEKLYLSGALDRRTLSEIVFNNPEKLQQLNAIIHPAVKADFMKWLAKYKNFPFVIKESAILFESGTDSDCAAVITVTAPLEIRIQRVMKRDQTDRESILKRIENQWSDSQRSAKSDFVIDNVKIEKTMQEVKETLKMMNKI